MTTSSSISKHAGAAVGAVIGILAVVAIAFGVLFYLKRQGKINSYIPSFLSRGDKNISVDIAYKKQNEDLDSRSLANKNFS